MARFRSKPTEIDAVYLTPDFVAAECPGFEQVQLTYSDVVIGGRTTERSITLWVEKSKKWCEISEGDAIVAEPDGSGFYPCARDIFDARWEAV